MKQERDSKKFLQTVGGKFYSLRKMKKKDLDEVAKSVKISSTLLKRIENGDHDMSLDLLFDLCAYYGIAPQDFL